MRLERLPYTLNGKLDRDALKRCRLRQLPAVRDANTSRPEPIPKHVSRRRWQRMLNDAAPIGRADRFFERGGDSLAAMQLQAAIRIDWRVNLRLDALFDDPSLEALAALIDRKRG